MRAARSLGGESPVAKGTGVGGTRARVAAVVPIVLAAGFSSLSWTAASVFTTRGCCPPTRASSRETPGASAW
jgi:hypothetical protein